MQLQLKEFKFLLSLYALAEVLKGLEQAYSSEGAASMLSCCLDLVELFETAKPNM